MAALSLCNMSQLLFIDLYFDLYIQFPLKILHRCIQETWYFKLDSWSSILASWNLGHSNFEMWELSLRGLSRDCQKQTVEQYCMYMLFVCQYAFLYQTYNMLFFFLQSHHIIIIMIKLSFFFQIPTILRPIHIYISTYF